MKRLLVVLLLVMSANSYAEWTPFSGNDEFTDYIDRTTIRRNGNFVKIWSLTDYKTVQNYPGNSSLSGKTQSEYDCKEERKRTLAFSWFSGQMGNGTLVYSNSDTGKWSPIQPGSIGEATWEVACGKR